MYDNNEKRIYLGKNKEKKCCICTRKEPKATFKQKAHIIPASFGNRWLFSQEECDECNMRFGKKYENELASMFSSLRTIGRIRKRKGYPKIRVPKTTSCMQSGKKLITISMINGEGNFEFKQLEDNTLSLSVPAPPYYPIDAIKSIAHTLWLVLDERKRTKYKSILKWITNEIQMFPVNFYDGFMPGSGDGILSFSVWEKTKENEKLADLIVKFHFSNAFIFWELPDFKNDKYLPGILPATEISIFPPYEPKLRMISIQSNKQMRPQKMNFTMHYEKFEELIGDKQGKYDIDMIKPEKVENKYAVHYGKPFTAKLTAVKDNAKVVIDYAYLVFKEINENYLKILITNSMTKCNALVIIEGRKEPEQNGNKVPSFNERRKGYNSRTKSRRAEPFRDSAKNRKG